MLSTHCRARGALRSLLEGSGTEISFPEAAPSPLHRCPGHPRAPSSAHSSGWLRAPISTCSKVMSLWEGPGGSQAPPHLSSLLNPPWPQLCSAQRGSGGTKDTGKDTFLSSGPAPRSSGRAGRFPAQEEPPQRQELCPGTEGAWKSLGSSSSAVPGAVLGTTAGAAPSPGPLHGMKAGIVSPRSWRCVNSESRSLHTRSEGKTRC